MKKKAIILLLIMCALPAVALAADAISIPDFPMGRDFDLVALAETLLNIIWLVFTAFATMVFIWAGVMFLSANGDATKIATARRALVWGAVGVVVAILAFSVVSILSNAIVPPPAPAGPPIQAGNGAGDGAGQQQGDELPPPPPPQGGNPDF